MTRFATITERSSDLEKTRTLENETLRLKGNESLKKRERNQKYLLLTFLRQKC